VAQPMYSVRFPAASSIDVDIVKIGRPVYFVPARSSYVFAEALQRYKGSDASNAFDEEPGDDEVEFSDDEKEAEFKRNKKQA
jgi:H/ACA ribonucleoprotein complex non-core subunit NAF1